MPPTSWSKRVIGCLDAVRQQGPKVVSGGSRVDDHVGDVGADIFCREIQGVWNELYPFADRKALAAEAKLGLGRDTAALAKLVPRKDLPRLLAALGSHQL